MQSYWFHSSLKGVGYHNSLIICFAIRRNVPLEMADIFLSLELVLLWIISFKLKKGRERKETSGTYLAPWRRSMTEFFGKIVNVFWLVTFRKNLMVGIWQVPKCSSWNGCYTDNGNDNLVIKSNFSVYISLRLLISK